MSFRVPNWLKTLFFFIAFLGSAQVLLRPLFAEGGMLAGLDLWFIAKIVFGILAAAILALSVFAILRIRKVRMQNQHLGDERFERIAPLCDALENNSELSASDVLPYAANVAARQITYDLLKERALTDLFPKEFFTIEHSAEGNLAAWLEFPTELDGIPDEIQHVKRVTIDFDGNNVFYHVFKYRIDEPHWAAKEGWMLGVVGPYSDDSTPYDWPSATFSRISSKFDEVTPEEEAKWVHENISMRG